MPEWTKKYSFFWDKKNKFKMLFYDFTVLNLIYILREIVFLIFIINYNL